LPANTGKAGAIHRVACFAGKSGRRTAAPTGYAERLRNQFSARQRSPKGWVISYTTAQANIYRLARNVSGLAGAPDQPEKAAPARPS
jgi:hypothetical protein